MKKLNPINILIIILIVVVSLCTALAVYKNSKNKLLDKPHYKEIIKEIETAAPEFKSNEDLRNHICAHADSHHLDYKVDEAGNIIFSHESSEDKIDVSPVVVCVGYNYKTAIENARVLASASVIAASDIESGSYKVIFFNNEDNLNSGYHNIDKKYLSDDTKLIYLDIGKSSHISTDSFANTTGEIKIPCELEPVKNDTAIKIKIDSVNTSDINTDISKFPKPIDLFGSILTRLNNKSIDYQLADVKVVSNGNMYPSSMEATIFVNSFSVDSLTSYLDERAKKETKKYKDDFPDFNYSYEIVENISTLPNIAYSKSAASSLNSILYTVKNGNYRFDKENVPDGYEVDDVYGINCINNLYYSDGYINVNTTTSALNRQYLKGILKENKTAAEFANASFSSGEIIPAFSNADSRLANDIYFAYIKVNKLISTNFFPKDDRDSYFTPCSILKDINEKMDIVHMCFDEDDADLFTNTLLCFLRDNGNFLSL